MLFVICIIRRFRLDTSSRRKALGHLERRQRRQFHGTKYIGDLPAGGNPFIGMTDDVR